VKLSKLLLKKQKTHKSDFSRICEWKFRKMKFAVNDHNFACICGLQQCASTCPPLHANTMSIPSSIEHDRNCSNGGYQIAPAPTHRTQHKGNPTICRPTWNPHRPPRRPYARFLYFLTGSPFWQRFRVLLVPVVLLANHRVSGGVLYSNEKTHKKRPRNRSTSAVCFAFATRKRKTPVRFSATQPVRHERCFRLSRTRHVRTTGKRDGRGHVGVSGFCTFAKTQHRTPSDNYLRPLI
jgi:hypothetical protein